MATPQTVLRCVYAACCCFFFFFIFSSAAEISYSDHCSSIVPESIPTVRVRNPDFSFPLYGLTSRYYFWGGEKILGSSKKSPDHHQNLSFSERTETHVSFRPNTRNVFRTESPGVYKVEAILVFRIRPENRMPRNYFGYGYDSRISGNYSVQPASLRFALQGFLSEDTMRLCMVGKSKSFPNFGSVFEFAFGRSGNSHSTIFTSLAKGSLKSLSPYSSSSYFDPVEIVSFPYSKDYNYTLSCSERNDLDVPPKQSFRLKETDICSTFQYRTYEFDLEYEPGCYPTSRGCSPVEGHPAPSYMTLSALQCSEEQKNEKLRYIVSFWGHSYASHYSRTIDPYSTLIGEGSWDSERNQLCIVACRIINPVKDLEGVSVGDCSFRLSLRFPVVWTIKNTSSIVGLAWSNKTETDFGYFMNIKLSSSSLSPGSNSMLIPGLRYEYTQTEKVRTLCPKNQVRKSGDNLVFPRGKIGSFYDMSFSMSAKHGKESIGWGEAFPIAFGDELVRQSSEFMMDAGYGDEEEELTTHSSQMSVSYKLSFSVTKFGDKFFSVNSSVNYALEVNAEGVYDAETGHLCMVGCRHQFNMTGKLLDCDIVMKFQFPDLDSKVGSSIDGSMESKRAKDDSLYFRPLKISGSTYNRAFAVKTMERMDVEIILVLTTNTLLCVFVASQILHVKKHPECIQSVSLVMLTILAFGHMVPLVLNLEALLLNSHDHQQEEVLRGEGFMFSEVCVRMASLVIFLLLSRLLQIKWTVKVENENGSERKAAFATLVLYGVGGVLTLLVQMQWMSFSSDSTLKFLKSYVGLVLDGFLLPQILLNLFQNSASKSLSCWFYMGTTLVRLFPHAYDSYRARYFIRRGDYDGTSYIYASPGEDLYSIAWDVAIPCGCVVLAGIIWMQQRFGGRCILPRRMRELGCYEKLPTAIVSE